MESRLIVVPEPLAAFIANKGLGLLSGTRRLGALPDGDGRAGLGLFGLDLLQRLVLVLLKPVEGTLHCWMSVS